MNLKKYLVSAATILFLAAPTWAADGWERNSEYNQHYNSKTVQTLSGKIVSVDRNHAPLKGMMAVFSAIIQPEKGEAMEIQVGPSWFTSFYRHDWNIQPGDQMIVSGSVVTLEGHTMMIVSQGQKGQHKLTVRNHQGQPVWDFDIAGF